MSLELSPVINPQFTTVVQNPEPRSIVYPTLQPNGTAEPDSVQIVSRIQDQTDFQGPVTDGYYLRWDGTDNRFVMAEVSTPDLSNYVDLDSDQTISGNKTFDNIVFSNVGDVQAQLDLGQLAYEDEINLAGGLVSGTLPVSQGGTGVANLTANRILFGNGTSALSTNANITFNPGSNNLALSGFQVITNLVAGTIPFRIAGAASQSALLTDWRNSSNVSVASVGSAGAITGASLTVSSPVSIANGGNGTGDRTNLIPSPLSFSAPFDDVTESGMGSTIESNSVTVTGDTGRLYSLTTRSDYTSGIKVDGTYEHNSHAFVRSGDTIKLTLASAEEPDTTTTVILYDDYGNAYDWNITTLPFTPNLLGGTRFWFDAEHFTYNVPDTTLATDGQTVAQWKERSLAESVATQSTEGNKPKWEDNYTPNGKPAVVFDADDTMTLASYGASGSWTIFICAMLSNNTTIYDDGGLVSLSTDATNIILNVDGITATYPSIPTAEPAIIYMSTDGSNIYLSVNGDAVNTSIGYGTDLTPTPTFSGNGVAWLEASCHDYCVATYSNNWNWMHDYLTERWVD